MSETTLHDAASSNHSSTTTAHHHPPLTRAATCPTTPTSPLAASPWHQQKFELVRHPIIRFDRGGFFFYLVSWCDRRNSTWWISWSPKNASTTTSEYRTFNSQRIRSRFPSQSSLNELPLLLSFLLILDQFTRWTKYGCIRCLQQWQSTSVHQRRTS